LATTYTEKSLKEKEKTLADKEKVLENQYSIKKKELD
jgi:hypothetical protein